MISVSFSSSYRKRLPLYGTAIALIVVAIACGGGGDSSTPTPPAQTNKTWDVSTFGESFLPFSQTVAVRDTVRWTFSVAADGFGHNVLFNAAPGAPPDIGGQVRSGTQSRVFTSKGTFNYVCSLHGGMTGVIVAQ